MSVEQTHPPALRQYCRNLVETKAFERFIIAVIVINGVILGLATVPSLEAEYGPYWEIGNQIVIAIFVIEAALKIYAVAPHYNRYFGNGWNLFDFFVVVFSLIPATGPFAPIARLARLFRLMRLISAVPEMRLVVSTLVRSIPSIGHVLLLLAILFYIYAVIGYHLFHEHDPAHWNSLGLSLLTLFRVVTLEDWTDVMYTAMEEYPLAWIYFVSFVVVGTFVVVNLFIAVVLNNLEAAKREHLEELRHPPKAEELLAELRETQATLGRLQERLETVTRAPLEEVKERPVD
ncbi:Ion transport protein [Nitrosococcus halophilus Nc 4]|uniref:Ion transport protein n=1 Tax=Nitrosococcus halophilus (strain Nc4) TaxID=472759 RepID=D5BXR1_NITHN|nr:ion transporter [Nitrosococcus halophilus]ADE14019.1 Ion transport protein [Nitrosococcus halophilus Nc 4]